METEFTPYAALAGGALIGLSAVLLMALHGKIAGMTAILSGAVPPFAGDWPWRLAFLIGAVAAPVAMNVSGSTVPFEVPVSTAAMVLSGLVVGVGVTYGSGCTSGHGVCGLARLSPRSLVATVIFMATAFATVFFVRHVIGG
jgi:uncharacterized membrane protein YedE/YeeE